jgi:hypothetical protein
MIEFIIAVPDWRLLSLSVCPNLRPAHVIELTRFLRPFAVGPFVHLRHSELILLTGRILYRCISHFHCPMLLHQHSSRT